MSPLANTILDVNWGVFVAAVAAAATLGSLITAWWYNRKQLARARPRLRVYVDGISTKVSGGRMLSFRVIARNETAVLKKILVTLWWAEQKSWQRSSKERTVLQEDLVVSDTGFVRVALERPGTPLAWAMKIWYTDEGESQKWTQKIRKEYFPDRVK